jgi:hypothetical protein
MEGNALGIQEGKALGSGLCHDKRKEAELEFYLFTPKCRF